MVALLATRGKRDHKRYNGPIAWWFAALLGGAFFVFIFLGIAWGRWKLIQAKAVNKWAKKVDAINPMDSEFRNQRINLADLANPVTKQISRKRFINCELIGPATIFLGSGNGFRNSSFLNVNMIPVKNNLRISAVYLMIECDIIESVILEANILFPIAAIPFLENGFPNGQIDYLSLTGIPEIDNRSPQGIAPGTPL